MRRLGQAHDYEPRRIRKFVRARYPYVRLAILQAQDRSMLFHALRRRDAKRETSETSSSPEAFSVEEPAVHPADLRCALDPTGSHTNTGANRKFGEDNASIFSDEQRHGRHAVHSQHRLHAWRARFAVRFSCAWAPG